MEGHLLVIKLRKLPRFTDDGDSYRKSLTFKFKPSEIALAVIETAFVVPFEQVRFDVRSRGVYFNAYITDLNYSCYGTADQVITEARARLASDIKPLGDSKM